MAMTLAVFTDLDGTLLDHDSYSFAAALPAIVRLRTAKIPLILASSKTAAELHALRVELELTSYPAIVENGAGILAPNAEQAYDDRVYKRLCKTISQLPYKQYFYGFSDMTAAEVSKATGLSIDGALLAQRRGFTEPGLFNGTSTDKAEFIAALTAKGITARDGGRFLTLSYGHTKADRMAELIKTLALNTTIALGDAPNDTDMLLAADYAVIIRNDHAPEIGVVPDAIRTEQAGPTGWNTAVLNLLDKLNI